MKPKSLYSILLSTLLTMSASLSTAGDGGSDTGAGHVIGSTSVAPSEIKNLILRSKEAAKYVIRGYEAVTYVGDSIQYLQELQNKLYNGPKTFSEALKAANLKPIDQGACFDKDGNKVEASAINAPDLCFDPAMISKRVNSDSVQVEVLALVLHEVAHMIIGTSEDEAIKLQQIVRDHAMKNPIDKIPETARQNLEKINFILTKHIETNELQYKREILSVLLVNLWNDIDSIRTSDQFNEVNGFTILTKNDRTKLMVAFYKTLNMLSFSFDQLYTKQILAAFGDKKQISLLVFIEKISTPIGKIDKETRQKLNAPYVNYRIRKITPNDSKTFTLEMNEIEKLLKEVYVSINAK